MYIYFPFLPLTVYQFLPGISPQNAQTELIQSYISILWRDLFFMLHGGRSSKASVKHRLSMHFNIFPPTLSTHPGSLVSAAHCISKLVPDVIYSSHHIPKLRWTGWCLYIVSTESPGGANAPTKTFWDSSNNVHIHHSLQRHIQILLAIASNPSQSRNWHFVPFCSTIYHIHTYSRMTHEMSLFLWQAVMLIPSKMTHLECKPQITS